MPGERMHVKEGDGTVEIPIAEWPKGSKQAIASVWARISREQTDTGGVNIDRAVKRHSWCYIDLIHVLHCHQKLQLIHIYSYIFKILKSTEYKNTEES